MGFSRSENKGVTRNLPSDRLLSAPMQPLVLVLVGAQPLPQRLTGLTLSDLLLPLHRRLRRCTAHRRLLEQLQPQLTRLPLQRLELLVLHLRRVLLLTLPHVGQSVLERQIHDPRQLMRRRRQRRRGAQPRFHPTQKGPQRSLAPVQAVGRQAERRRRTVHPGTRPTRLHAASRLLPVGT